jgi:hypothetical protein
MNVRSHLALLALLVVAGACGSNESSKPASSAAPGNPPAATASPTGARVFFVEPQNGASVKSPVHLKFGSENYQIAPVPQGTVETSRPGMGHHHVAVDADCLPTGTVIPKASPWVHFGDGKSEIDMQLPPGSHKLTLQLGDDQHKTIEGLCSTINVNVTQ